MGTRRHITKKLPKQHADAVRNAYRELNAAKIELANLCLQIEQAKAVAMKRVIDASEAFNHVGIVASRAVGIDMTNPDETWLLQVETGTMERTR